MSRSSALPTRPAKTGGNARPASSGGISVIICTYQGAGRIGRALASLAAQSLAPELFEIVVVLNGPDDGAAAVVEHFAVTNPILTVRLIREKQAGVSHATNVGLAAATRQFFTLLDDDDWLSEKFLEIMLEQADEKYVVCAPLADVANLSRFPNYENYINRGLFRLIGLDGTIFDAIQAAAANGGKVAPRLVGRSVLFDEGLSTGQDTVYWNTLFAVHRLGVRVVPPNSGAVYFRAVRHTSISRTLSEKFIEDRLGAIRRLSDLAAQEPDYWLPIRTSAKGQASNLGRALRNEPDAYKTVMADADRRNLDLFSRATVNRHAAKRLVIAYVFAPYNDPSAITMAKRLRSWAEPFDVITFKMGTLRPVDKTLTDLVRDWCGQRYLVKGRPAFQGIGPALRFAEAGSAMVSDRMAGHIPYEQLYSRAMWPASHVLGALLKIRYPQLEWTAEFSDPLAKSWQPRAHIPIQSKNPLLNEIMDGLTAAGAPWQADHGFFAWIEHLALALADHVIFTNDHQRDFMLGYQPAAQLARRGREIAVVSAHPTLPPACYAMANPEYELPAGRVNIGYFGSFYDNVRGPGDLVEALSRLTRTARNRIMMHLFVPDPAAARRAVTAMGASSAVRISPYCSYFEMLALAARMDWLIVADIKTADVHPTNPYLPSKYSDYLGTGRPIWGLVETGSVLDSLPLAAKTRYGDIDQAVRFLQQLSKSR